MVPPIAGVPSTTGPVPVFVTVTGDVAVGPAPVPCCPKPIDGGLAPSWRKVPVPVSGIGTLSLPAFTVTVSDCGVVDGKGLGLNARAALISRGFAEMSRFGLATNVASPIAG